MDNNNKQETSLPTVYDPTDVEQVVCVLAR